MRRPVPDEYLHRRFDLIVIGGGINGAAIARDAALRRLSVLLLEAFDFGSGTTAWSTRLIHGGLRYLEHRELGLVRESLRERERLLQNAPHLVKPLPLYIPIYERTARGPLTIRAGMTLYDLLSFDKSLTRHTMLSRDEALKALPGIEPEGLKGAARFYDAQATFPERLVIENLVDATNNGALVLNHALVESITAKDNVTTGVKFRERRRDKTYEVRARTVVNVAGPWVDEVLAGEQQAEPEDRLIGGTKGAHCFVPLPAGMEVKPIYCEARSDGRPIFLVPWNGLLMIGTTDSHYAGEPDDAVATPEEIDYLISEAGALLPGAGLSTGDVLFSYAGIRPLPNTEGKEAGITRRHFVVDHAPDRAGLFSIVGGKLTTHRGLAEDAVDTIVSYLGIDEQCATADRPLPGATGAPLQDSRLTAASLEHLNAIYGSRSKEVITIAGDELPLLKQLTTNCPAIRAELIFAFAEEMAESLADFMLRRAMIGYTPGMGLAAAEAATRVGKGFIGWRGGEAHLQLGIYKVVLDRFNPKALEATTE